MGMCACIFDGLAIAMHSPVYNVAGVSTQIASLSECSSRRAGLSYHLLMPLSVKGSEG